MELEIGKTYKVNCLRKGKFTMRVTGKYDIWTNGVITEGETQALLEYNKLFAGEKVTVRSSFILSADECKGD